MRASVIALIALPIAAGGVAAAAVVGFRSTEPPSSHPGPTATAGTSGAATDEPTVADEDEGGTTINGSKPHLSIIDRSAPHPVPAPVPSALAQLTVPPVSLAPLPPHPGDRTEPANAGETAPEPGRGQLHDTLWPRDSSAHSDSGSGPGKPPSAADLRPVGGARPAGENAMGGVGDDRDNGSEDGAPGSGPATPAPTSGRPPAHSPESPEQVGRPVGPPPHADEIGRPPHAGAAASPGRQPAPDPVEGTPVEVSPDAAAGPDVEAAANTETEEPADHPDDDTPAQR